MRILGNYILRGRLQAIATVTAFTLLSLLIPPAAYILSGTPLGLVTLRKGRQAGIQVMLGAMLMVVVFALIVQLPVQLVVVYAIFIWFPVWFCAAMLRLTAQQGMVVLVAGLMAMVVLTTLYVTLGDVSAWWQEWLNQFIDNTVPAGRQAEYRTLLLPAVEFINALLVAGLLINLVTTILLSRWWQSILFNPGGFSKEFQALNLPAVLLILVTLVFIASWTLSEPWSLLARDVLIITIFMFLFQGLALIHRTIKARQLPAFWLVIMYILLFIVPQTVLFLACVGMADCWYRSRRQIRNDRGQD